MTEDYLFLVGFILIISPRLRHLPRFPDFFVTFRILPIFLYYSSSWFILPPGIHPSLGSFSLSCAWRLQHCESPFKHWVGEDNEWKDVQKKDTNKRPSETIMSQIHGVPRAQERHFLNWRLHPKTKKARKSSKETLTACLFFSRSLHSSHGRL